MQAALFGTTPFRQASSSYRSRFKTIGVCEICGRVFRSKAPKHELQRTCGRKCGIELRRRDGTLSQYNGAATPVPWRNCQDCGKQFIGRYGVRRCADCYAKLEILPCGNIRKLRPIPSKATCKECGREFKPERRHKGAFNTVFCTERCCDAYTHREARYRRRAWRDANKEDVGLATIAKRDGWRCHICGKRVTKKTWSLDHLVPLSKGGSHTKVNVALAHQYCNSIRGADRLPAQLLLVG